MTTLKQRMLVVIERVGVTDMAMDILIDLVLRHTGKMGGRPRKKNQPEPVQNGLLTGLEPVETGLAKLSLSGSEISDPGSDPGSSDLSKQTEREINIKGPHSGNAFAESLRDFCETWERRHKVRYLPTPADRNQLGRLLAKTPREELVDLSVAFRGYLADESPWVAQEQRHNLAWFCTSGGFNKYRAATVAGVGGGGGGPVPPKEAATVAGLSSWLKSQGGAK